MNTAQPAPTPETDAAEYAQDFTKAMMESDFARKLERGRDEARHMLLVCRRGLAGACSGFIGASEVARRAISTIEKALKKGMTHSRRDLEHMLPRLTEGRRSRERRL